MRIRVFIGSEKNTRVAEKVLIHSIKKRSSSPVEIEVMDGSDVWDVPSDLVKTGTGFSLRRFLIPWRVGYEGWAVYLDSDMQLLDDITEMVKLAMGDPVPGSIWCTWQSDRVYPDLRVPQSSAMVLRCDGLEDWYHDNLWSYLEEKKATYHEFMHLLWCQDRVRSLPKEWNHMDRFVPGRTKIIHYTRSQQAPWFNPRHPHREVWENELADAVRSGSIPRSMIRSELSSFGKGRDGRLVGLHRHYSKYGVGR